MSNIQQLPPHILHKQSLVRCNSEKHRKYIDLHQCKLSTLLGRIRKPLHYCSKIPYSLDIVLVLYIHCKLIHKLRIHYFGLGRNLKHTKCRTLYCCKVSNSLRIKHIKFNFNRQFGDTGHFNRKYKVINQHRISILKDSLYKPINHQERLLKNMIDIVNLKGKFGMGFDKGNIHFLSNLHKIQNCMNSKLRRCFDSFDRYCSQLGKLSIPIDQMFFRNQSHMPDKLLRFDISNRNFNMASMAKNSRQLCYFKDLGKIRQSRHCKNLECYKINNLENIECSYCCYLHNIRLCKKYRKQRFGIEYSSAYSRGI